MNALSADSEKLLQTIFGTRWQDAWVCWMPGNKFGKRVRDLVPGDLPGSANCYFSIALLKDDTSGRTKVNAEAVMAVVLDDVGTLIDKDGLDMGMWPVDPTFMVESSDGNWQVGWPQWMSVDGYQTLRAGMSTHPVWGHSHMAMDPVHLYRLPQGTNTKTGWKVRGGVTGEVPAAGALERLRGPVGAAGVTYSKRAYEWDLSAGALGALVDIIPNDPGVDRDMWITVLHGISGAGGTLEDWDRWSQKWHGYDAVDTQRAWDTLDPSSVLSGGGVLRALAERLVPDAFQKWKADWEVKERFADSEVGAGDVAAAVPTMHTREDFRSMTNDTDFIHVGTGNFWKPASVDANVAPVVVGVKDDGTPKTVKATAWMRAHRYVTELSWLPGEARIIENRSMGVAGLEVRHCHSVFNLYTAPPVVAVEEVNAGPWLELVRRLWPDEAEEILNWFAHRVQKPGEKVNHALVLGGAPGIGKDTVLEGVRRAVGVGNCQEIMPSDMKGSFNDYVKSVLLVVNELRDDATMSQYAFYEKSKTLIAAPPDTATINSKYIKQYRVPNVVGVVMTTNHRLLGLYLPADDRRHLVCWSEAPAITEGDKAFAELWRWMLGGGLDHIAAWLRARDLSGFDPKAPPRKTQAFLDIVQAAGSPEESALQDKIEKLGKPKILRIRDLKSGVFDDASGGAPDEEDRALDDFLNDHKYRKVVAEALGRAGYRRVINTGRKDGRWKIGGVPENVYGRRDVDAKEIAALAGKLDRAESEKPGNA